MTNRMMKDSGIEWVGEIPQDWTVNKVRYFMRELSVKNQPNEMVLSLYRDYGVIPKDSRDDNHNVTSLNTSSYKLVEEGQLVINKMKAWQGSLAISEYRGIISPAYYIFDVSEKAFHEKFLHYLFRNPGYVDEYRRLSAGIRPGQWDLNKDEFKSVSYVYPESFQEQQKIAAYLDEKVAHIDNIIEDTKKSIENLKAYKVSLITETVTKGLDPDVEMKDSGIEWAGEIPKHWEIKKIKWLFKEVNERNNDENARLLSLFTAIGVKPRNEMAEKGNKSVTVINYKKVKEDDLVVNKLLAWMGAIGFSDYEGVTSPDYDVYRLINGSNVFKEYYNYYFRNTLFKDDCFKYGRGIMLMRWRTYPEQFKQILVVNPPYEEQKKIVLFLNEKINHVDSLIHQKEELIKELDSYKKSLIYEYVTGKKEVK